MAEYNTPPVNTLEIGRPKDKKILHRNGKIDLNSFEQMPDGSVQLFVPTPHSDILEKLLTTIKPINFRKEAGLEGDEKISQKVFSVISIRKVLGLAKDYKWDLCIKHGSIYLFNGAYWKYCPESNFQAFLWKTAAKMGVPDITAEHHKFAEDLYKQFVSVANLPTPEILVDRVLINLLNGTFVITPENQHLKTPDSDDFLTYQLSFKYDSMAKAPLFKIYLDQVLPDKSLQAILSEFLGYVFIHPSVLKLEKALLIFGSGANGKSVLFDVVLSLLGSENVLTHSLADLTDQKIGYYRAALVDKLLNYGSELNSIADKSLFKALISGESVGARQIYGRAFNFVNACKFMFNTNELPTDVEHTHGFFRRFLIIPFNVTIPEEDQDKKLAQKIIENELPGVFNWVLEGLRRLLKNERFTSSEAAEGILKDFREQSDSVQMYLSENNFRPSSLANFKYLKDVFCEYRCYCAENGYRPCAMRKFGERLRKMGYEIVKKTHGRIVYMETAPEPDNAANAANDSK